MSLIDHQPQALAALDDVLARAGDVVDPRLWALVRQHIEHTVADGPRPDAPADDREAAACRVVGQMLVDVASLDDLTVQQAGAHFADGELADLVMASYAYEASTRLRVTGGRLLGGGA